MAMKQTGDFKTAFLYPKGAGDVLKKFEEGQDLSLTEKGGGPLLSGSISREILESSKTMSLILLGGEVFKRAGSYSFLKGNVV